ncbi:DNA translocase FtsK [Aureibaculum sp. 2210JD6-5]|uniref:DNA translocase FtsK n=1 Tax=Aureibaculum sp. 2210JD6-5 TaxID=3103957 RepID=UPI002AACE5F9|nr:DNA translocase FtsK [Aureibaculum sp. 2210JD6-5]MDY7396138.1 DNA translocase FtsK [Aureibaculum sp. 2210JD6-5]
MAKKKKTTSKTKKKNRIVRFFKSKQTHLVFGIFLALFAVFLLVSFLSFFNTWKSDQSQLHLFLDRLAETKNLLGKIGANISHFFIYKGFGISAFIIPFLLFFSGLYILFNISFKAMRKAWFWGIVFMIWLSVAIGFFIPEKALLSGIIGYELNDYLRDFIGKTGIFLILLFTALAYIISKFKVTPETLKANLDKRKKIKGFRTKKAGIDDVTDEGYIAETIPEKPNSELELNVETKAEKTVTKQETKTEIKEKVKEEPSKLEVTPPKHEEVKIEVEKTFDEDKLVENLSNKLVDDFGEFDPTLELSEFKFPGLDLLKDYGNENIQIDQEELEANKDRIVDTLSNYKIGIANIKATIGPTVTLYEIVPDAGVRISKIKNLEDDIALSLAALGIRIIAPIPGKGTIGIEVPNKKSTIVSMKSVLSTQKFQNAKMQLPLALGKTISNETFVIDLAKMPHLLMAGATGQGKSVGLNAVLTSLLYKKHPAEVKFVLVDPKKVELTLFNKIERHYLAKLPDSEDAIITDTTKVIHTLNSLCIEMDNRYDMLKDAYVRNIKEYNEKFKARKLNPENGHAFLPYIVLVIDEFADLIMTAGKEVETPIARLAQLARAVGIHLIVATQRPSVNVITGIIKANFPVRVAFRVTSKIDSRTILDGPGADQLIGKGDMLISTGNEITRLQCAFVDTPEVDRITDFIGSQRAYASAHLLPEYIGEENGTGIDIDMSERDDLFEDAAHVIVNAQQGSASLLQRKLKLGYNRAGRIIDQLEAAGIVGKFEGSKARQVLVPDILALEQLLRDEKGL